MAAPKTNSKKDEAEQRLIEEMARCTHDPLRWVLVSFEWGRGELSQHEGPDDWQRDILATIRDGVSPAAALNIAVASGHGPGKSALVAWIILWGLSTKTDTRGVVTANTESQLRTKTWAELAKWHRLCICKHWFVMTATAIYAVDPVRERTWRMDMVPWSETRTEAFAGLHNQGKRIIFIMDEASAIADKIWETSEGALTDSDTEIIWAAFGNPTRNTGRFRECFGRFRHRWKTKQVDSRTARLTNKTQIQKWIDDYGEDSDFVRVRVKGQFPRASSMQFIASDTVENAMSSHRDVPVGVFDPLIMGVDVARFGDDSSVICIRRGRDARSAAWLRMRGVDTMTLAARVVDMANEIKPDAIFVDGGGVGGGVVDRLRYLKQPVIEVQFGGKSDRAIVRQEGEVYYANKRAEMWGNLRDWLMGGAIPNDAELSADLIGVEYGYTFRDGKDCIILESKDDMKKRGLASPDLADALALTFAYPVQPSDHTGVLSRSGTSHQTDYNEAANMWGRK